MKSLVLITQDRATGDLVSTALGHQDFGAQTYVVPLSATGTAPATHWGCHTWATDAFVQAISACVAQTALPPAPWAAVGLDEAAVFSFCSALVVSVQNGGVALDHFETVASAHGLARVANEGL